MSSLLRDCYCTMSNYCGICYIAHLQKEKSRISNNLLCSSDKHPASHISHNNYCKEDTSMYQHPDSSHQCIYGGTSNFQADSTPLSMKDSCIILGQSMPYKICHMSCKSKDNQDKIHLSKKNTLHCQDHSRLYKKHHKKCKCCQSFQRCFRGTAQDSLSKRASSHYDTQCNYCCLLFIELSTLDSLSCIL